MKLIKGLGKWYWGWAGFFSIVASAIPAYLFLKKVNIPDGILLALLVVLALGEVYLFSYIRHNEKKPDGSAQMPEAPKPTKEILFILGVLANIASGYSARGALNVLYDREYGGQEVGEFTAVTGALRGAGLIEDAPCPTYQEGIFITDEGSKYYLTHKDRMKKVKKV
jgi:hypothetical protein